MSGRFPRERLVPGWDVDALAAAAVVVVGVGALGNEVAKNLALAGVGRLVLCDPDTVEPGNLSRSVLFRPGDAGRPKVAAASDALRALSAGLRVAARPYELRHGVGLGELAEADAVVGCLDTLRARMRLLGRCALVEAPLVDGATGPWEGEVRLRLSTEEPCYGCSLTAHQRGVGDSPWSCRDLGNGPLGAAIGTTALVAAWMTQAVLGLLLGRTPSYRLLRIDAPSGRSGPVLLTRDPHCPHHRPLDAPPRRLPFSHEVTIRQFLSALPPDAEPQSWVDFPVRTRCPSCGDYAEPAPERPAETASIVECPGCGQRCRLRRTVRLRTAPGSAPLAGLGVARGEILPVRDPGGKFTWYQLKA
ncbi:ThiF family adenylyltransferase [Kitasatospora putterlickiae]|uniref:ThiF family adenylyltransferase n=1 Tax=Kitasatospora putterlickiae TaxID=221725 RepID=UPI0031DC2268